MLNLLMIDGTSFFRRASQSIAPPIGYTLLLTGSISIVTTPPEESLSQLPEIFEVEISLLLLGMPIVSTLIPIQVIARPDPIDHA